MKKPRKPIRPKLPSEPTGFELLDLDWAAMAPRAESILSALLRNAHETWRTERGLLAFVYALDDVVTAEAELARTLGPTLVRLRQRQLRKQRLVLSDCTWLITSVLARSAQKQYPSALPGQVLLLVRDRLRILMRRAFSGLALPDSIQFAEGSE